MQHRVILAISREEDLEQATRILHDAWFDLEHDIAYDTSASTLALMLWREFGNDPELDTEEDEEQGNHRRCRLTILRVADARVSVDKWPALSLFMHFSYDDRTGALDLDVLGTASIQLRVSELCAEVVDTGDIVFDPRRL